MTSEMNDPRLLSDEEVRTQHYLYQQEWQRRQRIVEAARTVSGLVEEVLMITGRAPGMEYQEPAGALDSYPYGWLVVWKGRQFFSTKNGAAGVPGESDDWREVAPEGTAVEWSRPTDRENAYLFGELVAHAGSVWSNDYGAGPNPWEPGISGSHWTELSSLEEWDSNS